MSTVNIVCMKWGTLYGVEYVNNLRRGVARHLKRPHRFVCFTDDSKGLDPEVEVFPLPVLDLPGEWRDGRWRKLALFNPVLEDLKGITLFLDLDLVIIDSIDCLFDQPGNFLIIRDDDLFRPKPLRKFRPARDRFFSTVGNSSVFRYEIGKFAYIVDAFARDPLAATRQYRKSQQFQSAQLAAHGDLAYFEKQWCVSFKNHCVKRHLLSYFRDPMPPKDARIVVFAGQPKMGDVLDGKGHRWYRHIGNVDWLRRAWRG